MNTVETRNSKNPLVKKHATWISSAIQSVEPGKDLVALLAEWPHCGSRDCPEQSGMYHIRDAVESTQDEQFIQNIAFAIKDILPGLPESAAGLITPGPDSTSDRRYFRSLTTTASANLIALAAAVRQPDILADPLEQLVRNGKVMRMSGSPLIDHAALSEIAKIETDPVIVFRRAVMLNQSDNRYEKVWLQMLSEGRSDTFPVFVGEGTGDPVRFARETAVWGLLSMPSEAGRGLAPAIFEAGKIISQIGEYKNPAAKNDTYPAMTGKTKRDRDFRRIFVWNVLDHAGFDESVLRQVLVEKKSSGWEKWAVDSLQYLTGNEFTPISPLERIYRQAALAMHLENRIDHLAKREGIISVRQQSSPEHSTLTLIKHSIDVEIEKEIDSWTLSRRLKHAAYDRSISEGWFPDEIKLSV